MRLRDASLVISLLFLAAPGLHARSSPDPTRARMESAARLAALSQSDMDVLSTRAESGDREAQFWMGRIYQEGRIVEKDDEQARNWLLKSAEQEYVPAQYALGMMYWRKDNANAATWLKRAAQHGDSESQSWLGAGYEQGLFGTPDYKEAVSWILRSAKQGHPDAQDMLGQMYQKGEGVKQDYRMAAKWYRKAAQHVPNLGGAGQGRNNLGILYEQGLGVPKDFVQAYMWLSLANGDLSYAKSQMTPAEILEAERMAYEWKSRHQTL